METALPESKDGKRPCGGDTRESRLPEKQRGLRVQ